MGEFNVLPRIGQNKSNEVYVVGQLHVDLFEETILPGMALSNRQGYKNDDLGYKAVTMYARELLNNIIVLRNKWSEIKKKDRKIEIINDLKAKEKQF